MSTQAELIAESRNVCTFSPCRAYRYSLIHSWVKMPGGKFVPVEYREGVRRIMWVGLNPSTADEQQLDNTLRRIRWFSHEWGFTSFVMTNLFAYRATKPRDMLLQSDPVGPENDATLTKWALECEMIIAAWGNHGSHLGRNCAIPRLVDSPLFCLGINSDQSPRHPLYVPGSQKPIMYSV